MSSQHGSIYYTKPNLRDKPLFTDRFRLPALQEEIITPPSNFNLAETWNIVDILISNATTSRHKLSGSSWSFPERGVAWRHRSTTQRIIVPYIYKRCPNNSRITWNHTDGAQDTQTIHIRKASHHCWPRSPTVGWYGADDGNSNLDHINSRTITHRQTLDIDILLHVHHVPEVQYAQLHWHIFLATSVSIAANLGVLHLYLRPYLRKIHYFPPKTDAPSNTASPQDSEPQRQTPELLEGNSKQSIAFTYYTLNMETDTT